MNWQEAAQHFWDAKWMQPNWETGCKVGNDHATNALPNSQGITIWDKLEVMSGWNATGSLGLQARVGCNLVTVSTSIFAFLSSASESDIPVWKSANKGIYPLILALNLGHSLSYRTESVKSRGEGVTLSRGSSSEECPTIDSIHCCVNLNGSTWYLLNTRDYAR